MSYEPMSTDEMRQAMLEEILRKANQDCRLIDACKAIRRAGLRVWPWLERRTLVVSDPHYKQFSHYARCYEETTTICKLSRATRLGFQRPSEDEIGRYPDEYPLVIGGPKHMTRRRISMEHRFIEIPKRKRLTDPSDRYREEPIMVRCRRVWGTVRIMAHHSYGGRAIDKIIPDLWLFINLDTNKKLRMYELAKQAVHELEKRYANN